MRLIECYIEGFGKISKKKYDFRDGLNCIKSDNGSGKTTLSVFIKVMLYGMSDTKKTSIEENDRKHYLPWRGGIAGGTLTFSVGKKVYRIERTFGQKASDDTFILYDTALGKVSDDYSERLGEELFMIDADGFERTVFLSERALTPKSDNKSISAKLSDLVGCDGDIGVMDDALKILENQRKFYHKKGGSGELADIKAKISEVSVRLARLSDAERELSAAEKKLAEIEKMCDEARAEAKSLQKEREGATLRAARADYEKRYDDMKCELEECIAKRDILTEFFGGTLPSFEEIDEASYKSTEAKRLLEGNAKESGEEYSELAEYFKDKFTAEDFERTKVAISLIESHEKKLDDPRVMQAQKMFSKRIPTVQETDEIIKIACTTKKAKSKLHILAYVIGILLTIAGGVLGISVSPALYILSAVGIMTVILTVVLVSGSAKRYEKKIAERVSEFLSSLSDQPLPSGGAVLPALLEIRSSLESSSELLSTDTSEAYKALSESVGRFRKVEENDLLDAARETVGRYERYVALSLAEQYMMADRNTARERAMRLRREAEEFTSRFKISSGEPYSEIRRALTEYNRLTEDIIAKRKDIANFSARHELDMGDNKSSKIGLSEINEKQKISDERLAALEREHALTERLCRAYTDELDGRDELSARKRELEEKLEKYKENYEIIQLTKKYLSDAKDNMTARYLGKTKSSFEKYTSVISGITDEHFEMNTDFGVSKLEGASTRVTDAYSRGTRDLYNLAARLALVDSLYEGELPFVILDDPFTSFDDAKTKAALKLLAALAKERQVIYFTCSNSRAV